MIIWSCRFMDTPSILTKNLSFLINFLFKIINFFARIFSFYGEEFEDVELEGFDLSNQTLLCSNVCYDQFLQVSRVKLD